MNTDYGMTIIRQREQESLDNLVRELQKQRHGSEN